MSEYHGPDYDLEAKIAASVKEDMQRPSKASRPMTGPKAHLQPETLMADLSDTASQIQTLCDDIGDLHAALFGANAEPVPSANSPYEDATHAPKSVAGALAQSQDHLRHRLRTAREKVNEVRAYLSS